MKVKFGALPDPTGMLVPAVRHWKTLAMGLFRGRQRLAEMRLDGW